jgi:hypothetical protein
MTMEFDLKPLMMTQVSFNGRAKIKIDYNHKTVFLLSYGMHTASYNFVTDEIKIFDLFSATTTRHIKDFVFQITNKECSTKDLQEMIKRTHTREELINATNR